MKEYNSKDLEIAVGGALNLIDMRIISNIYIAEKRKEPLFISQLQKIIGVAPTNIWKHLQKLNQFEIVFWDNDIEKGKKRFLHIKKTEQADLVVKFCLMMLSLKKDSKFKELRK